MKDLDRKMDRLMNRWWKLPILVFFFMVLGIFFSPAESAAQAVPPRGQGLQMIRPLVPQPEPPVEREIRKNRQAIEAAKIELDRKIEVQKTISNLERLLAEAQAKWNCYNSYFKNNNLSDCKPGSPYLSSPCHEDRDRPICDDARCPPGFSPCRWRCIRAKHWRDTVKNLQAQIAKGKGGRY